MANLKNDYLRWGSKSIADLLVQKLSTTADAQGYPKFSDQIFNDSNIKTLIDVFAWSYDALTYYLNHGATEGMFADSRYFENMNRIVKILGYNPFGFVTSLATFSIRGDKLPTEASTYTIPKYSYISANGKRYSAVNDFTFFASGGLVDIDSTPIFYNGTWKYFPSVYIAAGIPFEQIVLSEGDFADLITPDSRTFIAHPFINIYIERIVDSDTILYEYTPINSLFDASGSDKVFELRLNENFQYTVKFGDGVYGDKLQPMDKIHIVYLLSDGPDGSITSSTKDGAYQCGIGVSTDYFQDTTITVDEGLGISDDLKFDIQKIWLWNPSNSSIPRDFETVDEIRENAPKWFRIQGKLVNSQDYDQYIMMYYKSAIRDLTVQNNFTYAAEFHKYLYDYGKLSSEIRYYGYQYADSCDFNNIYIWMKSHSDDLAPVDSGTKAEIRIDCDRIKVLTSELVLLDPLMHAFTPYVENNIDARDDNFFSTEILAVSKNHFIELVRDVNSTLSSERIRLIATQIIKDFFSTANNSLGMTFDISVLFGQLSNIAGVSDVNTIYRVKDDSGNVIKTLSYNGLSFLRWTPAILLGADNDVVSSSVKLKSFQFPYLFDRTNIYNKITVSSGNYKINPIEF